MWDRVCSLGQREPLIPAPSLGVVPIAVVFGGALSRSQSPNSPPEPGAGKGDERLLYVAAT